MARIINLIVILLLLSISSCSLSEDYQNDEKSSINTLISSFNGVKINNDNIIVENDNVTNMPILSVAEAYSILKDIRNKVNCTSDSYIKETEDENMKYINIVMNKNINKKYIFSLQLKTSIDKNNNLYYNGYDKSILSNFIVWNIDLFSFETGNDSSIKFSSNSYIIMKIEDNGIKYIKIPMKIEGKFYTQTMTSDFEYYI